ncbi:helix-turn-helix domain-containing protein [Paenibacillus lautus]
MLLLNAEDFGKYLRKLRSDRGLTLDQLAAMVELSKGYLSNIENGRRGIPSPELLGKLSEPLGVEYEELMIQAGYWNNRFTDEDRVLFEDIYQHYWEINNKIINLVKVIADDDGIFPDYLHKDIFKVFGMWLPLSEGNHPAYPFEEMYYYDFLNKSDDELLDEYSESTVKEVTERFNNIYNYSTIKKGIIEYKGHKKDREDFLNELIELMDKHGLTVKVNEDSNLPLQIELDQILDSSSATSVRYKGKLLGPDDRARILGMLSVLFDEKSH